VALRSALVMAGRHASKKHMSYSERIRIRSSYKIEISILTENKKKKRDNTSLKLESNIYNSIL